MVNRANIVNAAVDTLQIAGEAVTVPVAASGGASCQTPTVDFGGGRISVTFTGGAYVQTSNGPPTAGTVSAELRRNGVPIKTLICFTGRVALGEPAIFGSGAFTFIDDPGAGSFYYTVVVYKSSGLAATTIYGEQCSILALGVKR